MNAENRPKPPVRPGPPRQISGKGLGLGAVVFALVFVPLWFLLQMLYGFAATGPPTGGYLLIALIAGAPAAIVWAVIHFTERPPESGPTQMNGGPSSATVDPRSRFPSGRAAQARILQGRER